MIARRSPDEIELMRQANRLVAEVLERMQQMVAPGVTTLELDEVAETYIRDHGARPAFKGYHGFPATLCVSVNEQVVHGIPSDRVLQDGDIVSIDVGTILDGYYGDSAITVGVGEISDDARKLLAVTRESLERAIASVQVSGRISDLGHAVQQYVEGHGLSIVRDFVGHGIGQKLHEEPQIPNYGDPGKGPELREGMVLAIEPMVNLGTPGVRVLSDEWTAVTTDGSLSAHFEHTVAVTGQGPDVLSRRPSERPAVSGDADPTAAAEQVRA